MWYRPAGTSTRWPSATALLLVPGVACGNAYGTPSTVIGPAGSASAGNV